MNKFLNKKNGFTMIEILVVITIIGILATLILTNFGPSRAKARDVQRKTDLNQIKTALALYYNVWNEYPDGSSGSIVGCGPATLPPAPCTWGSVWSRDNLVYMKLMPSDTLAPSREYSYTSSDNNSFTIKALLENRLDKDIVKSQVRCGACSPAEADSCYVVCQD